MKKILLKNIRLKINKNKGLKVINSMKIKEHKKIENQLIKSNINALKNASKTKERYHVIFM
jgi:hypothetical protein